MKYTADFCEVWDGFLCSLGRIFAKFTRDFGEVYD